MSRKSDTRAVELVLAAIAQGAINIDEGLTAIASGSRVHAGMHSLCSLFQTDTGRDAIRAYLTTLEAGRVPDPTLPAPFLVLVRTEANTASRTVFLWRAIECENIMQALEEYTRARRDGETARIVRGVCES